MWPRTPAVGGSGNNNVSGCQEVGAVAVRMVPGGRVPTRSERAAPFLAALSVCSVVLSSGLLGKQRG